MTVGELIDLLEPYDRDAEVFAMTANEWVVNGVSEPEPGTVYVELSW